MIKLPKHIFHSGWALLPLRFMLGFGFAAHGYAKLSRGPEGFAAILAAMGIPAPGLTAWMTSLLEFLGGIALIAGAWVLPTSLALAVVMLTALFGVHWPYGFSTIKLKALTASGAEFGAPGYELNLLYLAGLLAVVLGRSKTPSMDNWLHARQ